MAASKLRLNPAKQTIKAVLRRGDIDPEDGHRILLQGDIQLRLSKRVCQAILEGGTPLETHYLGKRELDIFGTTGHFMAEWVDKLEAGLAQRYQIASSDQASIYNSWVWGKAPAYPTRFHHDASVLELELPYFYCPCHKAARPYNDFAPGEPRCGAEELHWRKVQAITDKHTVLFLLEEGMGLYVLKRYLRERKETGPKVPEPPKALITSYAPDTYHDMPTPELEDVKDGVAIKKSKFDFGASQAH